MGIGLLLLFLPGIALLEVQAGVTSSLYKEVSLVAGYSGERGWIGSRLGAVANSLGLEYFTRVSGDFGDYLTGDVQLRLAYDSDARSDEAWGLEVHAAWLEYKIGLGRNLRIGHFSPAYGLEPVTDTHGTLFQTLAGPDIGFKKDWGLGYRGAVGSLDLRAAGQLGSGMVVDRRDGSYLITARLGNPPGAETRWGVSVLQGRVLENLEMRTIPRPRLADRAVSRSRAGLDLAASRGALELQGEISIGKEEGDMAASTMVETEYRIPSFQTLVLEAQGLYRYLDRGPGGESRATIAGGCSYSLGRRWWLRAAVFHRIEDMEEDSDTEVLIHAYYFGD
jgi:hypothetical protein